jgi:hypothetical protein
VRNAICQKCRKVTPSHPLVAEEFLELVEVERPFDYTRGLLAANKDLEHLNSQPFS